MITNAKRVLAVIIAALMLCCGCSHETVDDSELARISFTFLNLNLNGELYEVYDNMWTALYFIDFDTMASSAICSRPNCPHNDPEVCSAIGMDNHPTIVGDKLYYFEEEMVWTKDHKIAQNTIVYSADLDGSNRKKIYTIENLSISYGQYIAIKGSIVYFAGTEYGVKEDNSGNSGYNKHYMCSYDLLSKEFNNYGLICEGYSSGAAVLGEYDGGLYIGSSYTEEKFEFDIFDDEQEKLLMESYIDVLWRLDLETSELTLSELPAPDFIGGGFYGYNEDGKAVVLDAKGKSRTYDGFDLSGSLGYPLINGMVFNPYKRVALDLHSGKVLQISDAVPSRSDIIAYRGGSYIGFYYIDGTINREYFKIPENEMFCSQSDDGEFSLDNISWKLYNSSHPDAIAMKKMTQKEQDEKMAADRQKYYEMLDPVLPERTQRYYELLGETPAMGGGFHYGFCDEGYYMTDCVFRSIYFVGGVIDTDLEAECRIDVSIITLNPDTGEEREISETFINGEGECGLKFIVYPDEGFYIYKNSVKLNFTSYKDVGISGGELSPELITSEIRMEERGILMLTGEWENLSDEEKDSWLFGRGE